MLYLIRGLPGSGKTTFVENVFTDAFHFEADQYFYDEEGEYNFDPSKLELAHRYCFRVTKEKLKKGYDVCVSNTFTTEKELEPYLELAKELGVEVTCLILENRHGNESVHNVPEETVEKMRNRFSVRL